MSSKGLLRLFACVLICRASFTPFLMWMPDLVIPRHNDLTLDCFSHGEQFMCAPACVVPFHVCLQLCVCIKLFGICS